MKNEKLRDTSTLYLVDVGVLLSLEDADAEAYSNVYDRKYGYYDENQYYVIDKEQAIKEVREYVKNGVERTYGVVSASHGFNSDLSDEEIAEMTVQNEEYSEVLFSLRKVNGQLDENFIKL